MIRIPRRLTAAAASAAALLTTTPPAQASTTPINAQPAARASTAPINAQLAAPTAQASTAPIDAQLAVPAARASTAPVDVQLLSITDFHGYLQPPSPADGGTVPDGKGGSLTVGGAAYLSAHLKSLRKRDSILFSTGDNFSGWPFEVDAFRDEPTVEVLNKLGVQFSTVGNHELDVSPSFLKDHMMRGRCFGKVNVDSCFTDSTGRRFHGANFPFSTGNIVDRRGPILPPYTIRRVHGQRVGFINLTVPDTPVGSTSYQPSLRSLPLLETANKYAARLKRRGVKAIVANVHDGGSAGGQYNGCSNPSGPIIDFARQASPDIDAIVTGHWHALFNCTIPDPAGNPRPVVEAGNHGRLISEINLSIDPRTHDVIRSRTTSVNHPVTHDVTPDPAVQRIADYWTARGTKRAAEQVSTLTGPYTRAANEHGESTLGDLAADVQYWEAPGADLSLLSTKPTTGSVALGNDLPAGPALFGNAWTAYGYGNPILTVTVTGAQIRKSLEDQWQGAKFAPLAVSRNVRYAYDPARPIGSRITSATINGKALDDAKQYRLAALAYTLIGADGVTALTSFTNAHRNSLPDHEAFIAYLKAHKTLTPAPLNRVGTS